MSDHEWLASLKAGDEVLADDRWHPTIDTVERVTATQIIAGNRRFRKSDGYALGRDSWSRVRIRPVTQKDRDRFEEAHLRAAITRHLEKGKPTLAELRAMHACIKQEIRHD
jgi:hypothetical protein